MEAHWVLERTAIGQDEVATRALKLPMMARAVLLMVDGRTELTELQKRLSGLPDALETLSSLYQNGLLRRRLYSSDEIQTRTRDALVRSRQLASAALDKVMQVPEPSLSLQSGLPVMEPGRRSLALARLYLLEQMERFCGANALAIRNVVKTANTREALLIVLADCRDIIEAQAGSARASRVTEAFYALLPSSSLADSQPLA